MRQFNIHWKGCPHRHLPRIRVASPSPSPSYDRVQGRSHAHIAAQDVVKVPFGPALEKSRQQQRVRALERRQSSRGSFALRTEGRKGRALKGMMGSTTAQNRKFNRASLCMSGALNGECKSPRDAESKSQSGRESSHCRSTKNRMTIRSSTTRTYDPRLPTRKIQRRSKSTVSPSEYSDEYQRPNIRSSCGVLPVRRRLSMRMSLSTSASTVRPIHKISDMPSRTASQQKALKVFTRELERHLVAQEAFRRAGLDKSSTSSSSMSIHSIVEFKPYSADFRAAGLAVTSKEQRGLILPKWSSGRPSPAVPSLVPETSPDIMGRDWRPRERSSLSRSENVDTTCPSITSTDSTVIVFASMDGASPSKESGVPHLQRIATRKTLPWLREAEERATLHSKSGNGARKQNDVSSSRAMTLASMTTIIDFAPDSDRSGGATEDIASGLRASDIKWLDLEVKPNTKMATMHQQAMEARNPPSAQSNKYDMGDSGDNSKGKSRPVTTVSKTSRMGSPQLRADHVFQDIVRNGKASTAHAETAIQGKGPDVKYNDTAVEGNTHLANIPAPGLIPPERSPPPPPIASSTSTSRTSPILTPTCIPEYDTPWAFEKTHQVMAKSHRPGERSRHDSAGTRIPLARPNHPCSCDPVKRKAKSQYRSFRANTQTGTTSWSTLKSAATSQSQTSTSTEQSATRNQDVLKGLQIALAAACDEDLDAWITEVSGCRVRRFLADLRVFEGLGTNALVEEAMRTARRRRKKMEAYRVPLASETMPVPYPVHAGDTGREKEARNGLGRDYQPGDATSDTSARRATLTEEIIQRKEARKAERERERERRKKDLEVEWREKNSPRAA